MVNSSVQWFINVSPYVQTNIYPIYINHFQSTQTTLKELPDTIVDKVKKEKKKHYLYKKNLSPSV